MQRWVNQIGLGVTWWRCLEMGRLDRIWKSQVEVSKDGYTRQDWEELVEVSRNGQTVQDWEELGVVKQRWVD